MMENIFCLSIKTNLTVTTIEGVNSFVDSDCLYTWTQSKNQDTHLHFLFQFLLTCWKKQHLKTKVDGRCSNVFLLYFWRYHFWAQTSSCEVRLDFLIKCLLAIFFCFQDLIQFQIFIYIWRIFFCLSLLWIDDYLWLIQPPNICSLKTKHHIIKAHVRMSKGPTNRTSAASCSL